MFVARATQLWASLKSSSERLDQYTWHFQGLFAISEFVFHFPEGKGNLFLGTHKIKDFEFERKLEGYAIKYPVFSFNKFPNVDKRLGPEMKSTGEGIQFIKDLNDPYFRELDKNRSRYLYN